jgi:hypothetical protein
MIKIGLGKNASHEPPQTRKKPGKIIAGQHFAPVF